MRGRLPPSLSLSLFVLLPLLSISFNLSAERGSDLEDKIRRGRRERNNSTSLHVGRDTAAFTDISPDLFVFGNTAFQTL